MKVFMFFCFMFFSGTMLGQSINSTTGNGPNNIYNDVIKRFVAIIKKQDVNFPDTLYITQNDSVYLQRDIIGKVPGAKIETLNFSVDRDLINILKNHQHPFINVSIEPPSLFKGKFYMFVNVDNILKKENERKYKFENGVAFFYYYDNKKKAFKFLYYEYPEIVEGIPQQ